MKDKIGIDIQYGGNRYHPEKDQIINQQDTVFKRRPDGNFRIPYLMEKVIIDQAHIDNAIAKHKRNIHSKMHDVKKVHPKHDDITKLEREGFSNKQISQKLSTPLTTIYNIIKRHKQMESEYAQD